jgi:flagella basal body P-ring formation protein FlgA
MVFRMVIGLFFCAPLVGQAAEVRLRSSAACNSTVVRVADIAEVFGDDDRVTAALSDIPLCPAPAVGGQRSLSQQEVQQLLALSGVDRAAAQVTGSETVQVLSEAQIGSPPLARRRMIAGGVRQAVFEADSATSRKQPHAPKPVAAPAPETKQPAVALVARGSTVTVHARAAGVTVTTSGKAIEAGAAGEAINVELADTRQRVLARVTGPQRVELAVDGRSAAQAISARAQPVTAAAATAR